MNGTDWHVIVNDYSVLLADWPWLQLLACCFVVRLGLFGCIFYVINALIEYLTIETLVHSMHCNAECDFIPDTRLAIAATAVNTHSPVPSAARTNLSVL